MPKKKNPNSGYFKEEQEQYFKDFLTCKDYKERDNLQLQFFVGKHIKLSKFYIKVFFYLCSQFFSFIHCVPSP